MPKSWQNVARIQRLEWATHRWPCTFQQRRSAKPIGVAVWPSSIDTAPLVRQSTLFHGPSLKNGTFSCASAFHLSVVVFFLAFTERCIGQLCHHTAVSCAVGNRSHAGPVSCLDFQPTRMRQNKKKSQIASALASKSIQPLAVRGNESARLEISAEYPRTIE